MNQAQPTTNNSNTKKRLVTIGILVFAGLLAMYLMSNPPEAQRGSKPKISQMSVEIKTIEPAMYQVYVDSFGTVKPRTQSKLVAQVSGQIDEISPNFREGGFFNKGEWLVTIDDRDYKVDVKVAEASLLDAQQKLAEEQARSSQAKADWQRLGKSGEPNDLVLRLPQLNAAQANVLSAEARLEKAQLALERTKVVAPYDGRILNKQVDVGQVVSNNAHLADIFSSDYVEVRLPINNVDIPLIHLPEQTTDNQQLDAVKVQFSSRFDDQIWHGNVVRTESSIDTSSQQLYVVAQIDDPYTVKQNGRSTLKIGQYLNAKLAGKILSDVIVIPNQSIYQGSYVYVVEEGVLKRRNVDILWKNNQDAVISDGLKFGDQLVLTSLGQVSSGTPVSVNRPTINTAKADTAMRPGEHNFERRFEQLPERLQTKLKAMAEEKGITLEQAMQQHKQQKGNRPAKSAGE